MLCVGYLHVVCTRSTRVCWATGLVRWAWPCPGVIHIWGVFLSPYTPCCICSGWVSRHPSLPSRRVAMACSRASSISLGLLGLCIPMAFCSLDGRACRNRSIATLSVTLVVVSWSGCSHLLVVQYAVGCPSGHEGDLWAGRCCNMGSMTELRWAWSVFVPAFSTTIAHTRLGHTNSGMRVN